MNKFAKYPYGAILLIKSAVEKGVREKEALNCPSLSTFGIFGTGDCFHNLFVLLTTHVIMTPYLAFDNLSYKP